MNMMFKTVASYRSTLFINCVLEDCSPFSQNCYTRAFNNKAFCRTNFDNDHYGYSRCFILPCNTVRSYNTWEQDFTTDPPSPNILTFHDFIHREEQDKESKVQLDEQVALSFAEALKKL